VSIEVIEPDVVIRQIFADDRNVNHKAPSGPTTMLPAFPLADTVFTGNSVNEPEGFIRLILEAPG
jgi:hypothetical protein